MKTKLFLLFIILTMILTQTINAQNLIIIKEGQTFNAQGVPIKKGTDTTKTKSVLKKPVSSDCSKAIKITLEKTGSYSQTVPPNGYGQIQEIQSKTKNDLYFFEKEHNSAWYYFDVTYDGTLAIKITPTNEKDDYDFLLFKYTDTCFCKDIVKQKIIPIRSNISRTGLDGEGITGLTNTNAEKNSFFSAGKGRPFSKAIDVKKGERYYLVLDNVYPNGGGHTIEIGYEKEAKISGVILNEENKPIKAEVILEDQQGNQVDKTTSNIVTGEYAFNHVWVFANKNYNLIYLEDSSFVKITEINSDSLIKNNSQLNNIKVILPKLKKDSKYIMESINFYGGSPVPLPTAYSPMKALYRLMKRNPKMIISIEGHVNINNDLELSQNRAKSVYKYLVYKGIDPKRMSTIGYSNRFMLFHKPKNEKEAIKNRRVEIRIISY